MEETNKKGLGIKWSEILSNLLAAHISQNLQATFTYSKKSDFRLTPKV